MTGITQNDNNIRKNIPQHIYTLPKNQLRKEKHSSDIQLIGFSKGTVALNVNWDTIGDSQGMYINHAKVSLIKKVLGFSAKATFGPVSKIDHKQLLPLIVKWRFDNQKGEHIIFLYSMAFTQCLKRGKSP